MSKRVRIMRNQVSEDPLLPPPRKLGPGEAAIGTRDVKRHQLHSILMSSAKVVHLSEIPEPLRLYGGRTLRYYMGGVVCEYRSITPDADTGVFQTILTQ